MRQNSIVILTPVKNEGWILEPFLQACSEFADHIILLIQDTHDHSREIAAKFPKAHVVENTSSTFNEKSRINQLLLAARKLNDDQMVLIALDADEIPINTEQALQQWKVIRSLPQAQNITFKKPDLLPGGASIVDLDEDWTLGFVDDGRNHVASEIHAQRVPRSTKPTPYAGNDIPILHVNLVRLKVNRSKRRMYCVIENVKQTQPLCRRLLNYDSQIDFESVGATVPLCTEWTTQLLALNLAPTALPEETPFWQDYEVLKAFSEHGVKRFHFDNIWDNDWEQTRQDCLQRGWNQVPTEPIQQPSVLIHGVRFTMTKVLRVLVFVKRLIKGN